MLIVEPTLFQEVAKWVVMGIAVLVILGVTFYALIGTFVSRKKAGLSNNPFKRKGE